MNDDRDHLPEMRDGQGATEEYQPAPLQNVEAEAALLGGLMIANDLIPVIAERVAVEDFYEPLHGRIFKVILRLNEKGRAANPVLLRPIFEHDPEIKQLGGPQYLAQLTGSSAAIVGLHDFADQIAELAVRRRVAEAMKAGYESLHDPLTEGGLEEVDDIVNRVQDTAYSSMMRAQPMKARAAGDMVAGVIERTTASSEAGQQLGFSCRSIPDLDKVIGRIEPGYHVLAGRPGHCKTTLAMTASWGWAADGAPGEYYHSEMTAAQVDNRQASDLSQAMRVGVMHDRIRKGILSDSELRNLGSVQEMAKTLPLNFVETGPCDIRRVESAAARAALRWRNKGRRLEFIVIDYLQNYAATDARGRLIEEDTPRVTAISKACVRIAKRLGIAVIALSQVARAVEDRKDKRPQLNDLRQSGSIEQDADTVAFVFREEVYVLAEKPKHKEEAHADVVKWRQDYDVVHGKLEAIGAKHRHQKPRTRTLRFLHDHYAIRDGSYAEGIDGPLLGPGLFDDAEEF